MKKLILSVTFIISSMMIQAQSDSLIHAYKQVCKTLTDYKFTSQDVSNHGDGKTISITLKVQNGDFVFSVNDDFRPFNDPFFKVRHGVKTLKAPYREMFFDNSWSRYIYIRSENGIELTYKGKKELIESYTIEGEKLTIQKLFKELQQLQTIVINEDFKGSLGGGSSSSSKKNTPKAAAPQQNKQQKASQPQQRQRKQLTSGN